MNTTELTLHISDTIANATSPSDMLAIYKALHQQLSVVGDVLEQQALEQGHGYEANGVAVIYKDYKQSYDYRKAVEAWRVQRGISDEALAELQDEFKSSAVQWNKLAEAVNAPLADFAKPKRSPVSIKVL